MMMGILTICFASVFVVILVPSISCQFNEGSPLADEIFDERSIIQPEKPWYDKTTNVQVDHNVHNVNSPRESNFVQPIMNNRHRQFYGTPISPLLTTGTTNAANIVKNIGVPIQMTVDAGKNLDLFTAKDYDGLDNLEDSYTKKLLSSIGLGGNQKKHTNKELSPVTKFKHVPKKIFHLIRNKMKQTDHSRRQRYNSKSILQQKAATTASSSYILPIRKSDSNFKQFRNQTKSITTSPKRVEYNINNKALTKIIPIVKKKTNKSDIKTKDEKKQKTISIDNKHLVKVVQLLNLLRQYSSLQITHANLLKKGDKHHKGARKQSMFHPIATIHDEDDKVYSSDYVPETETINSDIDASRQGEIIKQNMERLTTNKFLQPDFFDNSKNHHYVTIDTNTGEIIKEHLGEDDHVDKTMLLLGLVSKLANTVKYDLKKTPPKHSTGKSRALEASYNIHHLTPEIMVSVRPEHRTGGKKTVVFNTNFQKSTQNKRKSVTKNNSNELRKRMLNDINENLKFVNTTELESIQDNLLKKFRKENIVKF